MYKGQLTGLVFLDLTKAFDTLDHSVLRDKLTSLVFSKSSVQWFDTYLTGRTQSVIVNGAAADPGGWIGWLATPIFGVA